MSFRGILVLVSVLLFTKFSPTAFASHAEGTGPAPSPSADAVTATGHAKGSTKLTDNEFGTLKKGFGATDAFIRKWDEKLPSALDKAVTAKSEDDVAGILAKFTGLINNKQLDTMFEDVMAKAKGLEKGTGRYAELLKRMQWVKEILAPSPSGTQLPFPTFGEEFERFRTAFRTKFDEVKATGRVFYADLKEALGNGPGKQAAIERLRRYEPGMLFAFMKAQAESGNAVLANRLGSALSFSENGRNFLDGKNKDGKSVRIHVVGNDVAGAVKGFERENGSVSDLSFSPVRHPGTPEISYDPSTDMTTRTVASPGGTGQGKEKEKEKDTKDTTTTQTPLEKSNAAVFPVLRENCLSCHSGARPKGGFDLNTALTSTGALDRENVQRIYERAVNAEGGPMPPANAGGLMSEAIRAQITEWARLNGATIRP